MIKNDAKTSSPLLDVIIPTYNPGPYLHACLASCLNQDATDFQITVIDDASDEDVQAVVEKFADARLRFLRNPRRLGIGGNWNAGIRAVSAPYVMVFHQDDLMLPGNLARKVTFLDQYPDVAFVFSRATLIDHEGKAEDSLGLKDIAVDCVMEGMAFIDRCLTARDNLVCCPSVMMRRSAFEATGGFDEKLGFTLDLAMWIRLAGQGSVGYLHDPLISHRRHAGQTSTHFRNVSGLMEEYQVKREALERRASRSEISGALTRLNAMYIARLQRFAAQTDFQTRPAMQALMAMAKIRLASWLEPDTWYVITQMIKRWFGGVRNS
jgi:glycosyltransferase involved in cell wall biosynthesis